MARTEQFWKEVNGQWLEPIFPLGRDILIIGTNKYLNFGTDSGSAGYGFRDNGGTMQWKNSGGAWANIGAGGGGAVDSVNGYTGVVELDADDIDETASRIWFSTAEETKLGYISVSQAVDLDDMEADINALEQAVVLKGTWDASSGVFPGSGSAQAGWSYIVSIGGTVDGVVFTANDRIVAITDNASAGTYTANWHKLDYTDQVLSVNGYTGAVSLVKADVGLGNVDNTSNATERAAVRTLTNARVTKRVTSEASSATPTINTDNCDVHKITALATNITSMTTNLSGTPTDWQLLAVEIVGTATRTIVWGASFADGGLVDLPLTTDGTTPLKVLLQYGGGVWHCLAVS